MKLERAQIVANIFYNDILSLKIIVDDEVYLHEIVVDKTVGDFENLIFAKILCALRPVFFKLPLKNININLSEELKSEYENYFKQCITILETTNNFLNKYAQNKDACKTHTNILSFNVSDDVRIVSLNKYFSQFDNKKVFKKNMPSGFNGVTRQWEQNELPMEPQALIDYIFDNQIKKIISVNMYLLEKYFAKGIYLPALFFHLGVDYIIVDGDPYLQNNFAFFLKELFHCHWSKRFSIAIMHKYWDEKLKLENVEYIGLPQRLEKQEGFSVLDSDYEIIFLSNSRIRDVQPMVQSIMYVLSHFNDDNLFVDFQMWYWSLRHMILNVLELSQFKRIRFNASIYHVFYTTAQFLKYVVLDSIKTKRKINIYGDDGWGQVFPEYFQKKHLSQNEINELLSQKKYLMLMANHGVHYLNSAAPIYNLAEKNLPFINYSPLVKTEEFSGFSHLEYRNAGELNSLIENINNVAERDDVKKSLDNYVEAFNSSSLAVARDIMLDESFDSDKVTYCRLRKIHEIELERQIKEYINVNELFLRECIDVFLLGKPLKRGITVHEKYASRPFFRKLLSY